MPRTMEERRIANCRAQAKRREKRRKNVEQLEAQLAWWQEVEELRLAQLSGNNLPIPPLGSPEIPLPTTVAATTGTSAPTYLTPEPVQAFVPHHSAPQALWLPEASDPSYDIRLESSLSYQGVREATSNEVPHDLDSYMNTMSLTPSSAQYSATAYVTAWPQAALLGPWEDNTPRAFPDTLGLPEGHLASISQDASLQAIQQTLLYSADIVGTFPDNVTPGDAAERVYAASNEAFDPHLHVPDNAIPEHLIRSFDEFL